MTRGQDFEDYIRFEIPKLLNLSSAKEAAVKNIFIKFSDFTKSLSDNSPREFSMFFEEFKRRIEKISICKDPKGMKTISYYDKNGIKRSDWGNKK